MTHTSAATRMIEIRGADNFQSDFEISLFSAHIGPIVSSIGAQQHYPSIS